jgi:hypothetical protein
MQDVAVVRGNVAGPLCVFTPVAFPPGRLRLATSPSWTGCPPTPNTMGIVVATALIASTEGRSVATRSVGNRRTRSENDIRSQHCDRRRSSLPPAPLGPTFASRPMRRVLRPDVGACEPNALNRHERSYPLGTYARTSGASLFVIYGTAPGNCQPTLITTDCRFK